MKDELRDELIRSFSSMSMSVTGDSQMKSPSEVCDFSTFIHASTLEQAEPVMMDETAAATTRPKSLLESDRLPFDCDMCCRKFEDVRFVCLKYVIFWEERR